MQGLLRPTILLLAPFPCRLCRHLSPFDGLHGRCLCLLQLFHPLGLLHLLEVLCSCLLLLLHLGCAADKGPKNVSAACCSPRATSPPYPCRT